jgi:hypothetical protein
MTFLGRNRESRSREAAGRRNWPEAVPKENARQKKGSLPHSGRFVMEGTIRLATTA